MAARTEMLNPFGPRPVPALYKMPRAASFSPEEIRAAAEMALRRRAEKVAARLRRQLSSDEIKCLIECLQVEDQPAHAASLTS